jgi:dTMP kinase
VILGLEGVSCVGKTTLAAVLAAHFNRPAIIPCYYHASPDPTLLPDPEPSTAEQQMANLAQFLDVEALRLAHVRQALGEGRDVILDRTVATLLAHGHAIGRMNGFDCDDRARTLVSSRPVVMPDLTLVLTADPDVLVRRASLRTDMPAIFYDRQFSEHFNAYLARALAPEAAVLDTTSVRPRALADQALDHVHRHQAARGRTNGPRRDQLGEAS